MEHAEIFWSLFSVDLDAALAVQPPDSWDAFALFQLLNDYMCTESGQCKRASNLWACLAVEIVCNAAGSLKNGTFHTKLVTTFAPMVVRYVDLMEHSIAQSIEKGFAKEKWEVRKWAGTKFYLKAVESSPNCSNGCATSEDMFWKLGALQTFISDLQWPEEEFRGHLDRRMKSLAADIISQCTQKYAS